MSTDAIETAIENLAPVMSEDPSLEARVERIERYVAQLVTSVNSIGHQTTWLCQSIDAAFKGFAELQAEVAKSGPLGLFKMLKNGMSGKDGGETENG